jgi:hypothetical protein
MQTHNMQLVFSSRSFADMVQVIGDQDPTAQEVYQWAAQLLNGTMDNCRCVPDEINWGLLQDLPYVSHLHPKGATDPAYAWELRIIQCTQPNRSAGFLTYVGPDLSASPWEFVWHGTAEEIVDHVPSGYGN